MSEKEILFKPISAWDQDGGMIRYAGRVWPVDTPQALSQTRKEIQRLINLALMERGVDILDIESAYIHPDTKIGEGSVIYPHVCIREKVEIGRGCVIGPFAYIRPGTVLADQCKIGDFVELKNSTLGEGTKVNHLTYVGDSDVGAHVNFGCGTVTVNYDGQKKHRTVIGDNAFIGCNTNLVAPVTVGEYAYTAAGSTINKDVPAGDLAIARNRQENKPGWAEKRKK